MGGKEDNGLTSEKKRRFGRKYLLAVVIICIIVIGVVLWQAIPVVVKPQKTTFQVNLPPMNLTLIALNGTQLVLNQTDIGRLPSFTSQGGLENSAGTLEDNANYTGVTLSTLLALVGGMNSSCSLNMTASDGYNIIFTYDQVQGWNFTTYDPVTGAEVSTTQPFTLVLAYYENGVNLTSDIGPLRLVILGPQDLLTDGHLWVYEVCTLQIIPSVVDWTLVLDGPNPYNMTREYFEAGLSWHNATWTDNEGNVWFGMPLWYLVGFMEGPVGADRMYFNETLADEGYTVNVINGMGTVQSFNSTFVANNDNIIVAEELNGAPLPAPYWPLRICGPALTGSEMLVNVVKIQMTNVPGS
jgi:hypothetical protein